METKIETKEVDKEAVDESKKKLSELLEKRAALSNAKKALQVAIDGRRRYDYEWMLRDMFRRGYHFSKWQPTTQTVILASRQTAKIPINIVAAQMRAIRNQVTSFRPKFEILPRYATVESKTQARYSGYLLDYLFDQLNLKTRIKETVTQGLTFSVGGPWEIYYDKYKKRAGVWLLDPFDFYIDPLAEELADAEYVIKAVRRPLDEVNKNREFDEAAKKEVTGGEARLAVSEYKQLILQAMKQTTQYNTDEHSNLILFEGYFKERKDDGEVFMRKIVWTDQNRTPLIYEKIDTEDYPFELYRADINPKEIYGEGWLKHTMPINRVIDMLESSVFEYNHRMAKGRIVVDKDAGVKSIHNIHGEIISKAKGSEVKAMDMPPLPISVSNQIDRMGRYIEDIGAVHDASLGRVPAGVKSGIGVAELKQSDSTGQDDLVDNLEDFLEGVAKKLLRCVSENYDKFQIIQALGVREGEEKYFAVVGKKSGKEAKHTGENKGKIKMGPDWIDLAVIGDDNNIRVTIGSWLGYTKEMLQEKVLKYAQLGLIDQATALRLLEFGGVDEIIQKTRKEAMLKISMNRQPSAGQQPGEQDQFALANTENQMITLENKDVPVDAHDDHLVHLAIHQEAIGAGNDDLLNKHMDIHQMYAEQPGQAPQPQGQTPEGISPQDQPRLDALVQQGGQPGGQPPSQQPGTQPQQGFPAGGPPSGGQGPSGGMPPGGGQPPQGMPPPTGM